MGLNGAFLNGVQAEARRPRVRWNRQDGILAGNGSKIIDNTAWENGDDGIHAVTGSSINGIEFDDLERYTDETRSPRLENVTRWFRREGACGSESVALGATRAQRNRRAGKLRCSALVAESAGRSDFECSLRQVAAPSQLPRLVH